MRPSKLASYSALAAALCLCAATAFASPAPSTGSFTRNEGEIGGRQRVFYVYTPRELKPGAPLLFMFHGGGGDGGEARLETGHEFEMLADRYGFVVAYPNGIGMTWNGCRKIQNARRERRAIDDVSFVDAMIAQEIATNRIDPKRVFAAGHSNGGALALRLALERPNEFAGIAAISTNLPVADNMDCHPTPAPISVMIMNGTADPVSPYDGGTNDRGTANGRSLATDRTVQYFADIDGLVDPPKAARLPHRDDADKTWVEQLSWTAPGKPSVMLYTIHGGGHVVPQPYWHYPREVGPQTKDLDAPAAIWDFFMKETADKSALAAQQVQ